MSEVKEIAFFDFDGTITIKDSLLEFLLYKYGLLSLIQFSILRLPQLIAFAIGLINNQKFKEIILTYFLKGVSMESFHQCCTLFQENRMGEIIRPRALVEIKALQQQNVKVVIVSASPENWILPWASSYKLEVIATKLEEKDNRLTGKILEKNCAGFEKVQRIKEAYNLAEFKKIYCYGNSKQDLAMLSLADEAYMRPFVIQKHSGLFKRK